MRWPWRKRTAPVPIPPYQPPIERVHAPAADPSIVVEEIDTSAMTQTGVHKAWKRLTGK